MAFKDKSMQQAYDEKWKQENTLHFTMRFQKSTDADIIEYIKNAQTRQGEIKRLIRLGMAYEMQGGTMPTAPAPVAPAPDKEIQRLARVGAEYEDMLRRGWKMVEPEKKEDEPISKSVQDALSRLHQIMVERRAREATQEEQEETNADEE